MWCVWSEWVVVYVVDLKTKTLQPKDNREKSAKEIACMK